MKKLTKEQFSLDVSSYSDFKDRSGEFIVNLIGSAPTLSELMPQTGGKANTIVELNVMSTDIVWTDADCPTDFASSTVVSPRPVYVSRISARESLCLDKFDRVLPMIQKAGAKNEELPMSELYINLKLDQNSYELEKLAWRGNTASSGNLSMTNGFYKIADDETGSLGHYATFSGLTAGNAISTVRSLIAARPDALRDKEDNTLYLSPSDFDILSNAIIDAYGIAGTGLFLNNGHTMQAGRNQFMFPGTNVRVVSTPGANSSLFLTNTSNLRYVTDLESDKENVELFYDKYHKAYVSDIVYAIGFNYEFPANVCYIKKV